MILLLLLRLKSTVAAAAVLGGLSFGADWNRHRHPIITPAFVVRNWGDTDVAVQREGKNLERGKGFRFRHRHTLAGTDLIVWLEVESTQELSVIFKTTP